MVKTSRSQPQSPVTIPRLLAGRSRRAAALLIAALMCAVAFAATAAAKPQAARYLAFLRSAAAKNVFERYGFSALAKPTS